MFDVKDDTYGLVCGGRCLWRTSLLMGSCAWRCNLCLMKPSWLRLSRYGPSHLNTSHPRDKHLLCFCY